MPVAMSRSMVQLDALSYYGTPSTQRVVAVPLALLLTKDMTPAGKLLWIRLRFDESHRRRRSCRPDRLAKRTRLARSTVYEVLKRAVAKHWLVSGRDRNTGKRIWKTVCPETNDRRTVGIPVALIRASHIVRPQEILCYGYLQALTKPKKRTGEFKWADIRAMSGLDLRTIKRAIRRLAELGWISLVPKNRVSPIFFRLQDADEAYKEGVVRRLDRADFTGEGLMREILSLISDSQECFDRVRPKFLVNSHSGELLELDRFYPVEKVAFEFNGTQHYVPTREYARKEVEAQRKRDAEKRRICKSRDITLVEVRAQDLSINRMLRIVRGLLPMRTLRGFRQTIRYINACCLGYRNAALNGET